jgi:hypothetical protein
MAQDKDAATLEMRIAAIEDKLAKMHITEEEMQTFQKVSALMGGDPQMGAPQMGGGSNCFVCIASGGDVSFTPNPEPSICQPIARFRGWPISRIPRFNCWNECGPIGRGGLCDPFGGAGGGGMSGGGGFGGFGF